METKYWHSPIAGSNKLVMSMIFMPTSWKNTKPDVDPVSNFDNSALVQNSEISSKEQLRRSLNSAEVTVNSTT